MLIAAVDRQAKINSRVECSAMYLDKHFLPQLGYLNVAPYIWTNMFFRNLDIRPPKHMLSLP